MNAAVPNPSTPPTQPRTDGGEAEARRVQARLRLLAHATQAVTAEFDLQLLYPRIAQSARELVDAEHVALGVLTADGAATQLIQLEAGDLDAIVMPAGAQELDGLSELVGRLTPGRVSRFTSTDLALPLPGLWADGLLAVPVHYRGRVLSVLLLSAVLSNGSRAEDEHALLTLATTAGIAIESAQLYQEARRRQDAGRRASEISNRILTVADDDEAQQIVTTAVQQVAGADLAIWWHPAVSDPETVEVIATAGPGAAAFDARLTVPLADFGPTAGALPSVLSTTAAWGPASPVASILEGAGIGSLLLLPIGGDHGLHGWLMCGRSGTIGFSDLDLDIIDIFVRQMSIALNLTAVRVLSERMRVLEDRERIARDLHDHVIQTLFAVGLKVQLTDDAGISPAGRVRLGEAVSEIDDSIRQLRNLIFQLNTESSAAFGGFEAAVAQVIEAVAPGLGFVPVVHLEGPLDAVVGPVLSTEIVAVLREAITNITRYAGAGHVVVDLVADGYTFTLTVTDDGVGIDSTTTRRSGLDNLRMRAELLGGDLVIGSPVGGGTKLRWTVPLVDPHISQRPTSRRVN